MEWELRVLVAIAVGIVIMIGRWLRADINQVRADMRADRAEMRADINRLDAKLDKVMERLPRG